MSPPPLCSPSRSSGPHRQYACKHRIIDNNTSSRLAPAALPQYLQQAGYSTAFIGSFTWAARLMPRNPVFDHSVSFPRPGHLLSFSLTALTSTADVPQGLHHRRTH
ncbi:MAG: sulfatase-like hydrolase/transferase [Bryobacterales bacterium]|nr:sulfatase-like hydrolase/transferase [Bryobacterales bacterium]